MGAVQTGRVSTGYGKLIRGFEYNWSPDPWRGPPLSVSINLLSGSTGVFGVSSEMIHVGQLCGCIHISLFIHVWPGWLWMTRKDYSSNLIILLLFLCECVCVNGALLEASQMVIFLASSHLANSQTLSENTSCLSHGITKPNTNQEEDLLSPIFAFQ